MNAKRIISAFLAALMLLGTLSVGMAVSAAGKITYSDVNDGMWSYKDIMYVSEHGLMNGTGGSTFSPAVDVTRSMVVTVLYRMEGSPNVVFDKYAYADVPEGEFYSDAVMWAKKKRHRNVRRYERKLRRSVCSHTCHHTSGACNNVRALRRVPLRYHREAG